MPTEHKKKIWPIVKSVLLMTVSSFLLAVADALFLSPYGINPGGIFGLSVAIDAAIPGFDCQDIVNAAFTVILFVVGWIVLGKKFSLRTLLVSILFPAFFALFYRLRIDGNTLSELIIGKVDPNESSYMTKMVLAGIAGGIIVGTGVGLSFLGKGSTGGVDVLSEIIAQHSDMKQDTASLIIDTCIVIGGACIMWPMGKTDIWKIIVGIGSAFACSSMIQVVFVSWNTNFVADIITSEYDRILEYIHVNMDRGSTIYDVTGGYSGEKKRIIRVAFRKRQLAGFKEFVAKVDPNAFVTIVPCSSINGEGFAAHQRRIKRNLKKQNKERKE